jgi:hypothetical protein
MNPLIQRELPLDPAVIRVPAPKSREPTLNQPLIQLSLDQIDHLIRPPDLTDLQELADIRCSRT